MCGVVGIVGKGLINQALYDAMTVLQHRGQDSAGIATGGQNRLHWRRSNGLVRDVFHIGHMLKLQGNVGIGHVRYPTAGVYSSDEAQPFYVNSPFGIALGHNGNLINADELKRDLWRDDRRHINTGSDSEVLLNVLAHELGVTGNLSLTPDDVFDAVSGVHRRCKGGYAAVGMIFGFGIVGFRDPNGIRPMAFGRRETPDGPEFMIASESVALDMLGFELIRDIEPGEAVCITEEGEIYSRQCAQSPQYSPCIFEYVYMSRPDSILDDVSVYKARLRMGEKLADKILREFPSHDIDVVIPIPDTSRTAAMPLAFKLGVKYREGFIKNRYIGRTFIMPGQQQRVKSVRQKLNAIGLEFEGKNVLLVDDSIVRGTTSKQIIDMAREAGALKVYVASAAPPIRYPNVYGIDMPTSRELIAYNRTDEQVRVAIGADRLFYQDLDDLVDAVAKGNPRLRQFDTSCFNGEYVTGGVSEAFLMEQDKRRSDEMMAASIQEAEMEAGEYQDVPL
jgi:amidophosphoribosyltransferase